MKKITAFVMATMILAVLLMPAVMAAPSPERDVLTVATVADIPAANADSPDFVFVEENGVTYAKYNDPVDGYVYLPEDEIPSDDKYQVVDNGGSQNTAGQWTQGSGNSYVVSANAAADKLVAVVLNGVVVDPANYTVKTTADGGTEIVFKPEYLATLSAGEQNFAIKFTDGVVKSTFEVKAAQSGNQGGANQGTSQGGASQTGDDSNTATWVAIGLIALGAVCMVSLTLFKTRKPADK